MAGVADMEPLNDLDNDPQPANTASVRCIHQCSPPSPLHSLRLNSAMNHDVQAFRDLPQKNQPIVATRLPL